MGFSVLVLAKKPSSSHRKTEKEHTRSYRAGISEKSFIRLLLDVVQIPVNGFRVEKEFNKIKRIQWCRNEIVAYFTRYNVHLLFKRHTTTNKFAYNKTVLSSMINKNNILF